MTVSPHNLELERRAKAIFDEVVDRPVDEYPALLRQLCDNDAALRRRVEALLAAHEHAENFIDPPPPLFGFDLDGPALAPGDSEADGPLIGQHIARYRVLRRLAAGGMGVVYLAEQDQPRRSVALKVMRVGLASRSMLRRFEHEAEVLGQLRHPGIAQVFEAGTFDLGRGAQPFFAMEFIDGRTLTDYAQSHELSTSQRLELIAQVCDAVHYAHQKGVVHRDLKPDNILVPEPADGLQPVGPNPQSANAQPKILDFGVARLTDSDFAVTTLQTDIGQIIGTLPYMSPEQIAADPAQVDTRSDVYALGVIAFELLTGEVPLDVRHKSMAEAARIIADHEPPSLTSINRLFRGDVSTIIAKALEKDKARRYQSAWELGEDIRRFLRHEPISARPATTFYQLRKFARRNKALVAGTTGIVLMLVLGVIGTSIGLVQARESARIARKQETAAENSASEAKRERATAEQVSRFLQQMLASVSPAAALGRDTALLRDILDNAAQRVDRELANQPDIAATLHGVIGRTYASISQFDPAISHLQTALELRLKLSGYGSTEVAQAQGDLGRAMLFANRFTDAQPLLEQALETTRRLIGPEHEATAAAMIDLANQRRSSGAYEEAESILREADAILQRTAAPGDESRLRSANDLANVLLTRRKFTAALPLFQTVLDVRSKSPSPDGPDLALAEANVSRALQQMNQLDDAQLHMQRALVIYRRVLPPGHNVLASAVLSMANLQFKRQQYDSAETLLQEAIDACAQSYGPESAAVARILFAQSHLAEARGDRAETERLCLAALEMRRATLPADHPEIAESLQQLATIRDEQDRREESLQLLHQALDIQRIHGASDYDACATVGSLANYEYMYGDLNEAVRLGRESLAMTTRLLSDGDPLVQRSKGRVAKYLEAQGNFADALELQQDVEARLRADPSTDPLLLAAEIDETGALLMKMARYVEAEPLLREGLEGRMRGMSAEHFATGLSMIHLGECLTALKKYEEAERRLLDGEAIWTKRSAASPQTREARQGLVDLYRAWGRPDDAAAWQVKIAPRRAAGDSNSQPASQPASAPASQPQP